MQRPTITRDQLKQGLGDKTKEAYDRKDGSGLFKTYLKEALFEERKVSRFNPGKGQWIIDIIPYIVGKNDPLNKEGDSQYVLDILVHMGIGPADERIVCLSQYNLPCPVCELIKQKQNDGADYKTEIKPLVAKRRTLYNVIVRENPEEEKKGVQILEMAHFFLQKNLAALSKNPRKGGYIIFSDLDEGKSVGFRRTGTGAENTAYDAHQFIDRPAPITDAEWQAAQCLDDFIVIRTYEDIYSMLHSSKKADKSEETQNEEQEESAPPVNKRRMMVEPEEQPETSQEEVEEETPEPQKAPPVLKAGTKKIRNSAPVCPVESGTFGVSFDEFVECDTCNHRDSCAAAAAAV
jgi:gp32 DNA binding protein like